MKLSELIQHVGDDNVEFQNIMHSSPDLRVGKKEGRIQFSTERCKTSDLARQGASGEKGEWTAFVIWLPTNKLPDFSNREATHSDGCGKGRMDTQILDALESMLWSSKVGNGIYLWPGTLTSTGERIVCIHDMGDEDGSNLGEDISGVKPNLREAILSAVAASSKGKGVQG